MTRGSTHRQASAVPQNPMFSRHVDGCRFPWSQCCERQERTQCISCIHAACLHMTTKESKLFGRTSLVNQTAVLYLWGGGEWGLGHFLSDCSILIPAPLLRGGSMTSFSFLQDTCALRLLLPCWTTTKLRMLHTPAAEAVCTRTPPFPPLSFPMIFKASCVTRIVPICGSNGRTR